MSTSNNADPEWDSHKATIESLYKKNELRGPGGVMDTMEKSHGFVKSKAQYEWRLKNWGVRKYHTKDEWNSIGDKVAKRKRAGKDSDVYIDNELVPKAKVQKQIRRHGFIPTFEQIVPALSPRTPAGFEVCTPIAEDVASSSQLQKVSPSLPLEMRTDDSRIHRLQNASPSLPLGMGTDDSHISRLQNALPSLPIFTVIDDSSVTNILRPWKLTYNFPFFELEAALYAQVRSESEVSLGTSFLLDNQQESSHEDFDIQDAVLKVSASLTPGLKALLPSAVLARQTGEQLISSPNNNHSDSSFSRLLAASLFAIANNTAGLNSQPMEEIMAFLKAQSSTQILQHILSTSGPESEAIAENLFLAAIESEDARIVEVLLQKGLNPDDLACTVDCEKYTPIERCSQLQNIELTRLLLRAKSDVNKTFKRAYNAHGAINCAIDMNIIEDDPPFELVSMLLDAGSEIELSILEDFIECSEHNEFHALNTSHLLIDFCAKTKPLDLLRSRVAVNVTRRFDNEAATELVIGIFQAGADPVYGIDRGIQQHFASTVDMAAECGNLALVQFLLRSRVQLTAETLTQAIKSTNRDLIRFLLDAGADVGSVGRSDTTLDRSDATPVTPLSEAIRQGDAEIMNLLELHGAWSLMGQKLHFEVALNTASEVGELEIVQRLLNVRADTTGPALCSALVAAIRAEQEAVVAMLFDAVIDRNKGQGLGKVLHEAVGQKNANLVRSILDADLSFGFFEFDSALIEGAKLGDHSIMEELIAIGANPNRHEAYGDTALEISVRRKDVISVQLLLDAGADVNYRSPENWQKTALWTAAKSGSIEIVEHLLSVGADPDDSRALQAAVPQGKLMIEKLLTAFTRRYPHGKHGYGCHALQTVIFEGDLTLVEFLLQANIDVNTHVNGLNSLGAAINATKYATGVAILQRVLNANRDPNIVVSLGIYDRVTALLAAITNNDIQKVQLLIDAGADVNWPATRGISRTPLQKAAELGSFQLAQVLIDKGGLVNAEPAQRNGATALQLAAIGGYVGIAELLLDNGADVNAPRAKVKGRTALEGAAEHGRIDMLRLLANAGASFHGPDYERALRLAKDNGHMATWRYLQDLRKESEVPIWDM